MTARVIHDSPLGTLVVPSITGALATAQRQVPVEVPDDVAGRAPGAWSRHEGLPALDDGRSWRQSKGVWEVRDPGRGLLAQDSLWRPAPAAGPDGKKA
jgi:hypothetical protein